jgi:hypothetical protein
VTRNYLTTKTTSDKGFAPSNKPPEDQLKQEAFLYLLGYAELLNFADLKPDCFQFVQKHRDDGLALFAALAEGKLVEAQTLAHTGPWTAEEFGYLLPELDRVALATSTERQEWGDQVGVQTLRRLHQKGLEAFYEALTERHRESFTAAETLGTLLEQELGAETVDTGALYNRDGTQEGPRDLVVALGDKEYAFRVFHAPYRAETDDALPAAVAAVVSRWETEMAA